MAIHYKNIDFSKITVDVPVNKTSTENKDISYQDLRIQYEGKDFYIKTGVIRGVGGINKTLTKDKKRYQYALRIIFDPANPVMAELKDVFDNIYNIAGQYIESYKNQKLIDGKNLKNCSAATGFTGFENGLYVPKGAGRALEMWPKLDYYPNGKKPYMTPIYGLDKKTIPWEKITGVDFDADITINPRKIFNGNGNTMIQYFIKDAMVVELIPRSTPDNYADVVAAHSESAAKLKAQLDALSTPAAQAAARQIPTEDVGIQQENDNSMSQPAASVINSVPSIPVNMTSL
jgi:hypothetical protein